MAVTRIHFKGFTARRYYTIVTYHVHTSVSNPYKGYCIYGGTRSGKTGLIHASTEIHFLSVRESCTHALPRNTKYLTIDGQVCFYRQLFTNAFESRGCISQP